jgi:hypothetical protein
VPLRGDIFKVDVLLVAAVRERESAVGHSRRSLLRAPDSISRPAVTFAELFVNLTRRALSKKCQLRAADSCGPTP